MQPKQLSVRLHGEPVGTLEQTPTGKLAFTYIPSATQAISLSLPIQEAVFDDAQCSPYFGGLLPESDHAKKAIGKQFGISFNNHFALLKAIGNDCAGAISFHEMNEPIEAQHAVPLEGKVVNETDLYDHIKALPKKPLFLGFEGLRLSLAGVHDKAAVCLIDEKITLPQHGCPTTHILKPAAPTFEGLVENEFMCLHAAASIGLLTPKVEIRQIKDISYLLIERYDRQVRNNHITRIHQEDFCQALKIPSTQKYQNEGGPSFKQCFALLQNTTQPAPNLNRFTGGLVYNYLIGNMDAHGKNFSLLHYKSQLSLAPFYDLVCTRFYPELTEKMAMKIGSKYHADSVLTRHWQQLCEEIEYAYPALRRLILKQGDALIKALETNKSFYIEMTQNPEDVHKIIEIVLRNVEKVLKKFA